eukprot:CAMPEP_0172153644 /NCGR_PEP_ID=MMETSP1050-20130122/1573_1 /TAXON_ID=233186 /ORGANISM="Cryptomonas curvata, Strain CCAP979/52" /LENGTH=138 /DNA_ID=CAMNT_0012822231 /DNA_START=186 /DNA_END=598 /DNA_ORIENTATION=-
MVNFGILAQLRAIKSTKKPLTNLVNSRRVGNVQNISNREQILSNEASQSIDTRGRNWIEAQDQATLFCINLYDMILTLGKAKPADNRLWRANNCSVVLRARYDSWFDANNDTYLLCEDLRLSGGATAGKIIDLETTAR